MSTVNKVGRLITPGDTGDGSRLARLRISTTLFFAVHGFVFAGFEVRIPAIKQQTGSSARDLGLALLCMSIGAVATMVLTGSLCKRSGSRRVTVIACGLLSVTVLLPALTHSAVMLGLSLLVFGAAYGGLNVSMNSVAVDLVAVARRPIMSSFHAVWSLGALAGAGVGALVATHLTPLSEMLILAPTGLIVTLGAGWMLLREPMPAAPVSADAGADRRRPAGLALRQLGLAVGIFGLIALCDTYSEGALGDWGALHLKENLGTGQGLAAAGFATFAIAEATGRIYGTRLLERLGQTRVLIAGGLLACAGMLAAALVPFVWVVFAGYALTGLGLANIFPTCLARAGAIGGPVGVSVAVTLGYGGFLLGPPAIGFLAATFGLPVALTTLAFLSAVAAMIAYGTRNQDRLVRDS